jgi:hypothetical protein
MNAVPAIKELISAWTTIEAQVKQRFPTASQDDVYRMTAALMNRSLGLRAA